MERDLYQIVLLSSTRNVTLAITQAQFLNSDKSPWNYMMATAVIYALPPVAIYSRLPPPHERRPHHGRRQRLSLTIAGSAASVDARFRSPD